MYHNFFIHSSVDRHLVCFHGLVIVNSASMNNENQVFFFFFLILVSSGCMPRSGIAGSYGGFILSFLRKYKGPRIAKAVLRNKNQPSRLQIILQSYSHHDSMVLAQKQKYRPMEQDRKSRNKPMHLLIPYFLPRRQKYTMGQRQPP